MDGPAAEPPRGTPNRRALGAMGHAVERARAAAARSSAREPAKPFERPRTTPSRSSEPALDQRRYPARYGELWLIVSVAVTATLVVIGAVALALSSPDGGQQAAPPTSGVSVPSHSGSPVGERSHASGAAHRPGSTAATTTTTTPPPSPGGTPVIASLSPASGPAGVGVQVAGANFLSANGQIVASFNGEVAPTSCPAQNVCTVTVPPIAGPMAAQVTITTPAGPRMRSPSPTPRRPLSSTSALLDVNSPRRPLSHRRPPARALLVHAPWSRGGTKTAQPLPWSEET